MTCLRKIDTRPKTTAVASLPPAERLISGSPAYLTWAQDLSRQELPGGQVRTGVWQATPGETVSVKGETFEFCHILEGRIEIIEEGQPAVAFGPGDSFVMKPGFIGVWRTLETVRKIYVVVG